MRQSKHKQRATQFLPTTPCFIHQCSLHCGPDDHAGSKSYCTAGGGRMAAPAAAGPFRSPVWAELQGGAQQLTSEGKLLEVGTSHTE
jgi:hypothetical protein